MEKYLEHHGIKGQKWGVRRTSQQLGHHYEDTAKRRYANSLNSNDVAKVSKANRKIEDAHYEDAGATKKSNVARGIASVVKYGAVPIAGVWGAAKGVAVANASNAALAGVLSSQAAGAPVVIGSGVSMVSPIAMGILYGSGIAVGALPVAAAGAAAGIAIKKHQQNKGRRNLQKV